MTEDRSTAPFAVSSCTSYHTSFVEDVALCSQLGIQGIGVWEYKLPRGKDDANADLFRDHGLTATFCFPDSPGPTPGDILFPQPKGSKERIEALKSGIRRLAKFDPVGIAVLAGSQRDDDWGTAWRRAVEGLREAGYVAGELGVTLQLEVIRPSDRGSLVGTIRQGLEMIEDIGLDNIGLLVDTFHLWDAPEFLSDIRAHASRIAGVQVNDHPPNSGGFWDRGLPGQGDMDLAEIIRTLEESGYRGWYELELFSDDGTFGHELEDSLWKLDPAELLARCRSSFESVWTQAITKEM